MDKLNFQAGMRVKAFDSRLFIDDKKTPLSVTMQDATVIKRDKEHKSAYFGWIDDCCYIKFDRDGYEGWHFTEALIHFDEVLN